MVGSVVVGFEENPQQLQQCNSSRISNKLWGQLALGMREAVILDSSNSSCISSNNSEIPKLKSPVRHNNFFKIKYAVFVCVS